jgi:hypothetical protein
MKPLALAGAIALAILATTPALAKSARCFTTDDGYYTCDFKPLGGGDFEVSAPGYPTFSLEIDSPGFAYGYAQYETGERRVPLPGMYVRSRDDGACWNNPETETRLCAW